MHEFLFGAWVALTLGAAIFCTFMWGPWFGGIALAGGVAGFSIIASALMDIHNWRYRREMKRRSDAYLARKHFVVFNGLCEGCENRVASKAWGRCKKCEERISSFDYQYCWECARTHRCCARCGR